VRKPKNLGGIRTLVARRRILTPEENQSTIFKTSAKSGLSL
jgi:hypothetical protein